VYVALLPVCCTADNTTEIEHTCVNLNIVKTSHGRIYSPFRKIVGGNVSYPENTNCTWYIKTQPGKLITLSFTLFDVEESHQCDLKHDLKHDLKQCCGDTWLSIKSIPSEQVTSPALNFQDIQDTIGLGPLLYCGKNLSMPPMVFTASDLILTFNTGKTIIGGRGFVLDYVIDKPKQSKCEEDHFHCQNGKCVLSSWICNGWDECGDGSDEQNCCPNGFSHCSSNTSVCYDNIKGKCNGIADCPNGEDEYFCALNCGSLIPCRSQDGCYNQAQRCNGIYDCFDNSDEDECDSLQCGPNRDGFLCRNRQCISLLRRCDGIQDCRDFSDEEACMKMSVITAVIIGSLICGLLLIIAAGCGLRLYHLRLALEQRWSTIRMQQRSVNQDFDEFGHRRPIMGRLPPPTYAQATGTFLVPSLIEVHRPSSHRHRRNSDRVRQSSLPSSPEVQAVPYRNFWALVVQRWRNNRQPATEVQNSDPCSQVDLDARPTLSPNQTVDTENLIECHT